MPLLNNLSSSKTEKWATHEGAEGTRINPGPFLGTVKNNVDPTRSGKLQVWIPELGGDPEESGAWRTVSYASPFFGVTPPPANPGGPDLRPNAQDFSVNPHSYGFWMVPPDIGNQVLCIFVNGDPFKGYYFASVPRWPAMHMVPAISGNKKNQTAPLVDINYDDTGAPDIRSFADGQTTQHKIIAQQLSAQGLLQDKERGVITSTAFRESPSQVFGFSTPGRPIGQPTYGPEGNIDTNAVDLGVPGRQGGHSFVMDDGDAQGLNQLVRLRTAGGHQITMHDTSGFIYIINKSGTAWLEMDRAGNINIYAAGQFNVAATGGIQLQSAGSVKIQGKKGVDISSDNNVNIGGAGGVNLASTKGAVKISAKTDLHLKGVKSHLEGSSCVSIKGGAHVDIVGGCITLNTGGASPAQQASTAAAPTGMPTKEPWTGHLKGNSGSGNSLNPSATGSQSAGTGPGGAYSSSTNYSGVPSQADVINAASTTVNRGENVQGGATVTTLSQNANGVNPVSSYVAYPDLIGKGVTLPGVNGTQCVALVQANSNLGNTSNWYPANNRSLFDNPPPQGTCIATFGASGNYTNTPGQSHAAIYLDQGQDQNGRFIVVQDQWVGSNGTQVRKIYEGGGAESAQNFRAIATQNNPSGVQVSGAPPVRQTDDNPPTQEGTTPRNNDTSVRPDTNTNSKTAVSPEDEAKLRAQQKQISEDSSAGSLDYGPPLIKDPGASASSAASTGSGQVTNNDQIVVPNVSVNQSAISVYSSIRDNAQNRVNTAQQNLDDLTIKKNSGLIDQATYDQQASKFQSQIDANQRTVDSAQNKINYSTQNVVEINKAQGFTNITSNSSVSGSGSGSLVISTSQTTYDPATGTWTTKTTGGPGLNAGGTNVGVGAPQYTDAQKQEINNLNGQQAQSLAIIQVNKNTIEHAQENIKDADQKLAAGEISIAERNDIVYKANADISAAQQTIGEETANLNQTTTKINEIDAAATQSNLVSGNDYQENAVAGLDYSDKLNTDSRGSVQDAENNTSQQIGYDETTGNTYTITNPDTSASRDLNYSAASTAAKDSPSGPQNVTNPDGAAVVQPNTDNSGDPFGGAAYANDVQQTNTGINRTVVNDQLSNVNSPYGDPPAIDTLSQQNTPSYRQSEIDSMQNYQSDQGPPAPITGNNNSPGSGGQGLPGAPQNNSPSSASGPTC